MPEQINSGSGIQYPLIVNPDGSLTISGTISTISPTGSKTYNQLAYGPGFINDPQFRPIIIYASSGADIGLYPVRVQSGTTAALFVAQTSSARTVQGLARDTAPLVGSPVPIAGKYAGSIFIPILDLGSYLMTAGSITSMPIIGASGTLFPVSGIVNQGTSPWTISGIVNIGIGSINIASNLATIGSLSIQGISGATHLEEVYTQRMDYNSDSTIRYLGLASPGVGQGSPSWQIRRYTWTNNNTTAIEFSSGLLTFTSAWSLRSGTTEAYS